MAVVGLSADPSRPSFDVAESLASWGYWIVPVNPTLAEWRGRRAFPSLVAAREAGAGFDLVDVFRRPEHLGEVVSDAIAARAKAIWFQLGVVDEAQARRAQAAGMTVVMDRCTKIEVRRLAVRPR